jgi:hypothetical protein
MANVDPPLPKSAWPFWLLTAGVIGGLPATSWIYFPALLRSGSLPSEGDSIGIPVFGSFLLAGLLSPIALGVTYLCVRHYGGGGTLFIWRRNRPLLSASLSVFFGVPALVLFAGLVQALIAGPIAAEGLWAPYILTCMAWLALLRAAALSKRDEGGRARTEGAA